MSDGKRYVLDANVFIQAHQTYYAFDICPGFWVALIRQHEKKRVFSIDKVKAELIGGRDALSHWARNTAPRSFFKGTADRSVSDAFADMMNWVQAQPQFTPEAKALFAAVADGWLTAYAGVNGLVVVTREEYAPEAKNRVPIPNVCLKFSVEYCNTFAMLRDLEVRFGVRKRG